MAFVTKRMMPSQANAFYTSVTGIMAVSNCDVTIIKAYSTVILIFSGNIEKIWSV